LREGSQELYFDDKGIPVIPEYIDLSEGNKKSFHIALFQ